MAMPLVYGRVAAEKIKVAFTIHIPYKNPFATIKYNGDGMIIMGTEFIFQFQVILCFFRKHSCCLHKKEISEEKK
jgi:hypothetical protein